MSDYYTKVPRHEGNCLNCGKSITLIGKIVRKFCSPRCTRRFYRDYRQEYNKKHYIGRTSAYTCAVCRVVFEAPRRSKYCSTKCRLEAESFKKPNHICELCNTHFYSRFKKARFCSPDCYKSRNIRCIDGTTIEQRCTQCGEWKPSTGEHYYRHSRNTSGWSSICKQCGKKKNADWRSTDHAKALKRANRLKNIETEKAYRASDRQRNHRREVENKLRRSDPKFALNGRMRSLVYHSIAGGKNSKSWQSLVGYSIDDLKRHVEKGFTKGMSWERFLLGEIHIDHRISISAFNFTSPFDIDFKRCWALSNLQPMWAIDNLRKNKKLTKPMQPSLLLAIHGGK